MRQEPVGNGVQCLGSLTEGPGVRLNGNSYCDQARWCGDDTKLTYQVSARFGRTPTALELCTRQSTKTPGLIGLDAPQSNDQNLWMSLGEAA